MIFREYIVDLMGDPGTLIPADAAGLQMDYDESVYSASPRDVDSSHVASSSSWVETSFEEPAESWSAEHPSRTKGSWEEKQPSEGEGDLMIRANTFKEAVGSQKAPVQHLSSKPTHSFTHGRSPSWTEGVSSPAGRRMKVKDVSQYMIDAAKENPHLAQKLHDVLLESGVVAPRNLFSEAYSESMEATIEFKPVAESSDEKGEDFGTIQQGRVQSNLGPVRFLPPLPRPQSKANTHDQREHSGPLGPLFDSSHSETSTDYSRNVPVAVAAAAVVASSMVVAAAKSANSDSSTLELSVAAAAAVVATAAAVGRQLELDTQSNEDGGSGGLYGPSSGGERISDRSTGNESSKSDAAMDDVAECEILWEEVTVAERIGLGTDLCSTICISVTSSTTNKYFSFIFLYAGSYGEVYRGDWHGTVSSS